MRRILFVGDPHAVVEELEDCRQLAGLVWGQAKQHEATVLLAGDLYHHHSIIHAEVQLFWHDFLDDLQDDGVRAIILKGNHDGPTYKTRATALLAHAHQATVVTEPYEKDGILFCPYTTTENLIHWSEEHSQCNTLICHTTFDGSVYENGFFASDGVDPSLIKQKQIISGHIHTPQEFGKVWYPGAPRWRTLHDANIDRALWVLDFDNQGNLVSRTPIDTGKVCRRLFHMTDTPSTPIHYTPVANAEYRVDIQGPQKWIDERKPVFEALGARVRTIRTDARTEARVRESDGVSVAFGKWVDRFEPRYGTPRETLLRRARGRVSVL